LVERSGQCTPCFIEKSRGQLLNLVKQVPNESMFNIAFYDSDIINLHYNYLEASDETRKFFEEKVKNYNKPAEK